MLSRRHPCWCPKSQGAPCFQRSTGQHRSHNSAPPPRGHSPGSPRTKAHMPKLGLSSLPLSLFNPGKAAQPPAPSPASVRTVAWRRWDTGGEGSVVKGLQGPSEHLGAEDGLPSQPYVPCELTRCLGSISCTCWVRARPPHRCSLSCSAEKHQDRIPFE